MLAIITGATKGIGRACAFAFAKKGFDLALCARTQSDLDVLQKELHNTFPNVETHVRACDVSIKKQVQEFGNWCLTLSETMDVLINNAGIFLPGDIHDEPDGHFEQLMHTNLFSAYHLTRVIVPNMRAHKKGHIFNMCSVASINAYDAGGTYAITKFGLLGFSKNLRHELRFYNIRVTAVLAGATLTESWAGTELPESRFMQAEDVAKAIIAAYNLSAHTVVEEILLRPQEGDI
ncbi:MAG: SDR family oxidoreductase [Chitinophagales bacterium]